MDREVPVLRRKFEKRLITYRAVVGDKYMCVVVKTAPGDAFVRTAFLTDTIKKGRQLWPRSE